jgi:hypothetical protein
MQSWLDAALAWRDDLLAMVPSPIASILVLLLGAVGDALAASAGSWPPACEAALQALGDAEDAARSATIAASAPSDRPADRLLAARRNAAQVCLGEGDPPTTPAGSRSKALSATSAGPSGPPLLAPRPPASPAMPARAMPSAPVTVTSCDATGCWASDGARLQKQGPVLVGPRGVCTQTAGVLNCP